jgi:hypothetical protein
VNHDPLDLLRGELAALRRQNRNLTFLACAAIIAAGVAFFRPQPQPGVVYPPGWTGEKVMLPLLETHGLALTDAEGRTRGSMHLGPDGSPVLALFDPDGRPRGVFSAGARGGETTYLDENGRPVTPGK